MLAVALLSAAFQLGRGPRLGAAAQTRAPPPRAEFGDNFYMGYNYAAQYGPQRVLDGCSGLNELPETWYELALERPLGIRFEENGGGGRRGVTVIGLVDGSNAAKSGAVSVGDKLVGVTAIKVVGALYERTMFDARKWDYDTVVDAVGSNEAKFKCEDVLLQFDRPPAPAADSAGSVRD